MKNVETKQLLDRGVYLLPCLDEAGYRFLIAVDSQHRCVQRRRLFNLSETTEQTRMLWRWLNQEDPA